MDELTVITPDVLDHFEVWQAALQRILAEGCKTISPWVSAANERAVRFYKRAGFVAKPESRKQFELGGATLEQVRYILWVCRPIATFQVALRLGFKSAENL